MSRMKMKLMKQLTVPNLLTILRASLIPVMVQQILVSNGQGWLAMLLFFGIWATDVLDGWIARHFHCVSDVGKVLDPLVDKIFQISTAYSLYLVGKMPLWVCLFLLVKDLAMILAGIFMWKRSCVVSAKWHGKIATVLFAFAFASVFLFSNASDPVSRRILYAAVFMAIVAWIGYFIDFLRSWRAGILRKHASLAKKESDKRIRL